ncbi:MAG: PTS transporter subunit EIIC [Lacrimispora sp.]|uniref:PTS transporter subunit EIIC n=1 Tax=Lacrimispora sp. TaxID=2719234 RepID=UPI0039E3BC66
MSKQEQLKQTSEQILAAIGGKENVIAITHCMTRLRLNLKDLSIPNDDEIKNISGVLGVVHSGGQLQVIIGQEVGTVYEMVCDLGGFEKTASVEVKGEKEKLTVGGVLKAMIDGLSGAVTPVIPAMLISGIFMMLNVLLGPQMLNIVKPGSDLNVLFSIVGDAGFYFFPVLLAYSAARKFNASIIVSIFLGGVLIHPTFVGLAAEGVKFSVYGIPATPQDYTHTLLPIVISVWCLSHVEKVVRKIVPSVIQVIGVPVLSMAIMLPLSIIVIGPLGNIIGNGISGGIVSMGKYGGIFNILAMAIIGALWQVFVMTGMHHVLVAALIVSISTNGFDSFVLPSATASAGAVWGMAFGAFLRMKNKEEKSLALSHFVTAILGGITEPALYGIALKYKRPFMGMIIGGFAGGMIYGISHATCYFLINAANFMALTTFVGGPTSNIVFGVIGSVVGFVLSVIITYLFGFEKDSPALKESV